MRLSFNKPAFKVGRVQVPRVEPAGHAGAFKVLIGGKGAAVVPSEVKQQGKGQLRRAAAIIAPRKTAGAVGSNGKGWLQRQRLAMWRPDNRRDCRVVIFFHPQ